MDKRDIKGALSGLEATEGWKVVCEYIDKKVIKIEKEILGNVKKEYNDKCYTAHDLLRLRRNEMLEMKDIVDYIVKDVEPDVVQGAKPL